jgi:hypothetical protein
MAAQPLILQYVDEDFLRPVHGNKLIGTRLKSTTFQRLQ